MNREQRRKYLRNMKHDKHAKKCPCCGNMTRHMAMPYNDEEKKGLTYIVCEYCDGLIAEDCDTATPFTYV